MDVESREDAICYESCRRSRWFAGESERVTEDGADRIVMRSAEPQFSRVEFVTRSGVGGEGAVRVDRGFTGNNR